MSSTPLNPSIERIAELQAMLGQFGQVLRVPQLAGTGRFENDIEHSYGLAATCWFMQPKIAPHLDLSKILMYSLAHDIVELYAGDTFAFDAEAVSTKQARETASLEKVRSEWPDFPELVDYAEGYATKRDEEAKFVYTVDKMLPSIMVRISEDGDFWRHHKVTREAHETEKRNKMKFSPEVQPYVEALNEWIATPDNFYKPAND